MKTAEDLPCQDDPEAWFTATEVETPSNLLLIAKAKAGCAVCPVTVECLELAFTYAVEYGVWGGKTSTERRAMLGIHSGRKRGRSKGIMHRYVEEQRSK